MDILVRTIRLCLYFQVFLFAIFALAVARPQLYPGYGYNGYSGYGSSYPGYGYTSYGYSNPLSYSGLGGYGSYPYSYYGSY